MPCDAFLRMTEHTIKTVGADETLLSRKDLSKRWSVSIDTLRRRERSKALPCLRFGSNLVRYRLRDIQEIEQQATS